MLRPTAFLAILMLGCSSGDSRDASVTDIPSIEVFPDTATPDALAMDVVATDASPAANCATTFGNGLPSGFLRVDGTVRAVLTPADQQCAQPNGTHVIVQVDVHGETYRMVVNIASTSGDPRVYFGELPTALPAPVFAEGWHAGLTLDYARDLGLHSTMAPFRLYGMDELVRTLLAEVRVGALVAVYSQGTGGASTHLVHRHENNDDGAVVLDPTGPSPRFLVFHFADQTF